MSPLAKYFKGEGNKVMADMQNRYGPDKGKRVFYATATKEDQKPKGNVPPRAKRKTIGQRLAEG